MADQEQLDTSSGLKAKTRERIKPKDLITVGIFTAVMILAYFVSSMVAFVPAFTPLLSVVTPIVGGIPFMLFATKTTKFGMVTIMAVLIGAIYALMGTAVWLALTAPVFGLIADLIMRSGGYRSAVKDVLGYATFSMSVIGVYIPIVFTRDAYVERLLSTGYTAEYADTVMGLIPDWSFALLLIACFVAGIVGAYLGRAVLKKHFVRAGIA